MIAADVAQRTTEVVPRQVLVTGLGLAVRRSSGEQTLEVTQFSS